ncbi:hypothetical protein C8Q76DRAFT_695132 [Earliella scabrosa]|nr:hypothetical protein C8Q76DRAFT_695132 [Earliella scabrosa]
MTQKEAERADEFVVTFPEAFHASFIHGIHSIGLKDNSSQKITDWERPPTFSAKPDSATPHGRRIMVKDSAHKPPRGCPGRSSTVTTKALTLNVLVDDIVEVVKIEHPPQPPTARNTGMSPSSAHDAPAAEHESSLFHTSGILQSFPGPASISAP